MSSNNQFHVVEGHDKTVTVTFVKSPVTLFGLFTKTNMQIRKETRCEGTRPRSYKTFFMFNSAELEILRAHRYNNIKKFGFF